jgi:hypothetical protein
VSQLLMPRLGVVVGGLLLLSSATAAQKPSGPQGESYASIARLPDWSGAWVRPFSEFEAELIRSRDPNWAGRPRLRPEYEQLRTAPVRSVSTRVSTTGASAPGPVCSPGRIPHVMAFSFAIELLPSPGRVTMLLEQGSTIRRIYTDGRAHSTDAEPSWAGDSIGHWEGDTLVVHTTHIKARPQEPGLLRTSDKAIVTERIRLRDKDHLQIDTLVEDPVTLLEPWRTSRVYERSHAGFFDRVCDNNRDGNDEEPNLRPPGAPR